MSSPIEDVYKSSLKFLQPLNIQETYKIIIDEVTDLVSAEHGSILLSVRGKLSRVYTNHEKIFTYPPSHNKYAQKSYATKKMVVMDRKMVETIDPILKEVNIRSGIIAPLINRDKSIGVVKVFSESKEHFTTNDKLKLQLFGPLASLAIRKAQLYYELNKAVETRDLFLSLASHELKTPITTIYIYLQLMQRNIQKGEKFDPEWIKTLLSEMVRLTKIIDELLELSRIRTGKLNYSFEESNIKDIVDRAIVNFSASHEHRIEFIDKLVDNKKLIIADFDKLVEVLINVLDNAAKHSSVKLPISLTLKSDASFLVIEVMDRGRGIPSVDLKRVFQGFFKTTDNTQPGMGLGLYLSKQIIDAHKGKIKIISEIGKGTTVFVYVPKLKLGKKKN